jgi:2-oxoglutarate ferredoxin oxidoreductase subunit alpha
LSSEDLDLIPEFLRYMPENGSPDNGNSANGSNVAPRTLPGVNPKGAFFTRGSGHNKYGGYTEIPDEYQEVMDRLLRKHREAAGFVPAPVIEKRKGARAGVITIGGCDAAVREALDILADQGVPMDYMRVRAFPFDKPVETFIDAHDYCYVVEQNRDAQLRSLLVLETAAPKEKLRSILSYGGFPLSAGQVLDAVRADLSAQAKVALEEPHAIYR